MNSQRLLTILLVGMLLSACAQFDPYRTQTLDANSQPVIFECAVDDSRETNSRKLCENPKSADSHAIQHRFYQTGPTIKKYEFTVTDQEKTDIGTIELPKGLVHIVRDGNKTTDAQDGKTLKQSDKLVTGPGGKVRVNLSPNLKRLAESAEPNTIAEPNPILVKENSELVTERKTGGNIAVKVNERTLGDYYLSFVEFDDQGWFADRKQMEALFALLKDLEKKDKETGGHTLIQVYAHGWKHNASACDNNVLCFSRLLERTDLAEKSKEVMSFMLNKNSELRRTIKEMAPENRAMGEFVLMAQTIEDLEKMTSEERQKKLGKIKPRTVVGVYLGWRGLPFDTALNNLSFWSRKDTAARVGSGGVFELLTRLKDYRDIRQGDKSADTNKESGNTNKTQLVITGHSFGGLVIYSALSHALMERATQTRRLKKTLKESADASDFPDPAAEYRMAKSFGDFVLLVNPAFEGSLYEPLFNIATNRCYENTQEKTQRPVMMIVTSTADKATGIAFPIGRALDTLFQHKGSAEQGDSMHKTIGHNERYKTHDLKLEGGRNTLDDKYVEKSACDCPHLRPTSELTLEQIQGDSFDAMLHENYGNGLSLKPVSSPKYASNYPYLVVTTDADVIADHNAIYNGNFTLFAQQFFQKHITLKQPLPLPADPVACWREQSHDDKDRRSFWRPFYDGEPAVRGAAGGLVPAERSCDDGGKPCTWQTPLN